MTSDSAVLRAHEGLAKTLESGHWMMCLWRINSDGETVCLYRQTHDFPYAKLPDVHESFTDYCGLPRKGRIDFRDYPEYQSGHEERLVAAAAKGVLDIRKGQDGQSGNGSTKGIHENT